MRSRKVTSTIILGAFLALGVFAFLGDRVLFLVYAAVAGTVLTHHAITLCPRCSNLACAFNPKARSGDVTQDLTETAEKPYSDLPITRTTVVPLLLSGPLAVLAAWKFSPVATIVVMGVALAAHLEFRELTCSRCGNDCAGNCNERYREWKRGGR